jgi:hypothetical protein
LFDILRNLLSDRSEGELFTCFGKWHIALMVAVVIAIAIFCYLMKKRDTDFRKRMLDRVCGAAFGLYMLDFFCMPFAYGAIEIEKLPFHACTFTCVMCFLSRNNKFFAEMRRPVTVIGFISNLCYLVYPAGIMWCQVEPFTYRAIQTLGFHALMVIYTFLAFVFDKDIKFDWKKIYEELLILCFMVLWAMIGNHTYSGAYPDYAREFNWFFTRNDPFGLFPSEFAPFVTLGAFFGMCAVIFALYFGIKALILNKKSKK